MKVLFISEFLVDSYGRITGGDEVRTFYTAKYLAASGHKVAILTSHLPGTRSFEEIAKVSVYRVGKERPYIQSGDVFNRLIMWPLALIWQGLKLDFDVVDGNSVAAWALARILGIIKRKKVVYWVPDILGKAGWQKILGNIPGLIAYLLELSCAPFPPDKVVALSKTTKRKLLDLGVREEKVAVVYPGISSFRDKKMLLHKPAEVVSVQRLVAYKRTDLVLKAIGVLKRKGVTIGYQIIGEGEEQRNLERLAVDLRISGQVKFLGNLPHEKVMTILRSSDIFTLPSETEGFGIVTLEAMAAGLPFINSDVPVHQEIAKESRAGLLFKPGDADGLAVKINYLINNQSDYQKLSQNAVAFARKHTWEQAAKKTEGIYTGLL